MKLFLESLSLELELVTSLPSYTPILTARILNLRCDSNVLLPVDACLCICLGEGV